MIIGIIPSRYNSTRFPGKSLANIGGEPMIQRVFERAKQSKLLDKVVLATDDERIARVVESIGGEIVITSKNNTNGTECCWDAYQQLASKYDMKIKPSNYIINIQGDQPFINPHQIDELASILDGKVRIGTQAALINSSEILHNHNEVKVIIDTQGDALYFSRQPIPYLNNIELNQWHKHYTYFKHIGLYAYRSDILQSISQLSPSVLEIAESLEQLRWIENGYRIKVIRTKHQSKSINSPSDIINLEKI